MSIPQLIVGVALLAVVNAASNSLRIEARETSTCEGRQSPGPICESCELLATCVRHSNGWVNIPVESCDVNNGYYCNARLGACTNATGPCHPFGIEGNFQCTSQGIFPDPYDCQKYHMCYFVGSTLVAAAVDCGSDKAFDARSGQCSLTLQSTSCTQKQFDCSYVGYVAPWPSNHNIFYVCKATVNQSLNDTIVIYPSLHRCNDGETFANSYCYSNGSSPSLPPSLPSDTDPNDPDWAIETARCEQVGLMADPQNCRKYYYCSGLNGVRRHMECTSGTYYRPELSSCTLGNC